MTYFRAFGEHLLIHLFKFDFKPVAKEGSDQNNRECKKHSDQRKLPAKDKRNYDTAYETKNRLKDHRHVDAEKLLQLRRVIRHSAGQCSTGIVLCVEERNRFG